MSVNSGVPDCNHQAIQPPFPGGLGYLGPGWISKGNVHEILKCSLLLSYRVACRSGVDDSPEKSWSQWKSSQSVLSKDTS